MTLASSQEHQTWRWQGYQLPYRVQGEGVPLVLIHGFGAAIGHWRNNQEVLAAAGYRVFAVDLLGFGAADKPDRPYSLDLWTDQLLAFWRENIGEPAVFVGNSIGALLSLMLVTRHPEIARGGVLINCAGGLNHRPEELPWLLRGVMGLFTQVVASPGFGPFIFDRIRRPEQIRRTLRQVYHDHRAVTDELVELIATPACDPGARQVFAAILTAPPGPKPEELLADLQRPLLVLWGDRDPWTPIAGSQIYQDLAEAGDRGVTFQAIGDAGHCPHDEQPDTVNRAILAWLETLAPLK